MVGKRESHSVASVFDVEPLGASVPDEALLLVLSLIFRQQTPVLILGLGCTAKVMKQSSKACDFGRRTLK